MCGTENYPRSLPDRRGIRRQDERGPLHPRMLPMRRPRVPPAGEPAQGGPLLVQRVHYEQGVKHHSSVSGQDSGSMEPMLPALAETVLFWSGGQRQVLVIHDEQSALTAGRLSRLRQVLADSCASSPAGADEAGASPARVSPLAGLVTVDSRADPRVQVADLLAEVARRLPGTVDDGPLQPFLSPTSLCDPVR
jgi:hypothetical protein